MLTHLQKTYVTVTAISILFLLTIIIATFNFGSYKQSLRLANQHAENMSHLMSSQIGNSFKSIDLILQEIDNKLQHAAPSDKGSHSKISELMRMRLNDVNSVRAFFVIGEDGYIIHDTDHTTPPHVSLKDRDYFQYHYTKSKPDFYIGPPLISRSTGTWFISVCRSISTSDGSFSGVIVAAIELKYIEKFYSKLEIENHTSVSLWSNPGRLFISYPKSDELIGKINPELSFLNLIKNKSDSDIFISPSPFDQRKKIVAFSRLEDYPLVVIIEVDKAALFSAWLKNATSGIILFALLIITLIVSFVAILRYYRSLKHYENELEYKNSQLLRAESIYLRAQEIGRIGNWEYDIVNEIFWESHEAKRLFDLDSKIGPDSLENNLPPLAARDHSRQVIEYLIEHEGKYNNEYEIDLTDEEDKVVIHSVAELIKDDSGTPVNIVGIIQDITERKQAETQLVKAKEQWEKTFDAMSDIVTIQNKDMHIVRANKAAHELFQVQYGELNGKHCYEVFTGVSAPCPGCPIVGTLQDGNDHSVIITNENLGRIFLVSSAIVSAENGDIAYLVHVARDITEQKNLEEQLFQAHKMEAMGTLAGGIAHDFNNILSAIIGYSELALQDIPDGNHATKDINQVLQSSKRAAELVRQILAFSRKSDHQLESMEPHLIIKEALKMLRASLPTTISLEEIIAPDCGAIMADSTNVHQIVVNLCTNAFHAMENEKGTLAVSLCRKDILAEQIYESDVSPGPYVVLSVSDTGQGMDKKTIERIFEPYFTTKEVGKGTGLGLAVIHGIVKDYKGFIRVDSELGKGSIFHVHFPALEQVVATQKKIKEQPLLTGTERILMVDDEAFLVRVTQRQLENLGYRVTGTTDSNDALEKIRTNPNGFDLLITDQTMPGLTGAELAVAVKEISPGMPIILCTGHSGVLTKEKCLALGIDRYVGKPIIGNALSDAVRELLDKK